MVTAEITNGILQLRVRGLHKLLALKNSMDIPLASIETAEIDAATARAGPGGTRNPGTSVPGVVTAGSFNSGVKRSFWDVHNPDKAIRIKLRNTQALFSGTEDRYDEVIAEVANPAETVDQINRALSTSG